MGLKAAFVAQMDQSVREQETSALNKAFLELIDSKGVDEFILSYHEIEYSAATILKELQKQYPHIKVTRTQESRVSADIYIVAYFCNTCLRYKTCDRESHIKSNVETKIPGKLNMSAAFYTRRRQCFTVAAEKFDTCGGGI